MLFGTPSQARAICEDWMAVVQSEGSRLLCSKWRFQIAVFKVKVPDCCVQSEGSRWLCSKWRFQMAVFKVKVPDGCVQSEGSRWLCSKWRFQIAVFEVKVPDGCVQSEGSRLLCSKWRFQRAVFKVKVSKVDCSSEQCLLNRWTVCNQTWYGDTSSWAGSRSQDLIAVFWGEGHSAGSKFISMMVYHCKPKRLVSDWIAVFWGEGHSDGSRLRQMFVRPIIFYTTNLATTLGALMCHY